MIQVKRSSTTLLPVIEKVTVTFSREQALVLSDWLDRMLGTQRFDALVDDDPAVWSPVYKLAGTLETTLPEIFAGDYGDRLNQARRELLRERGFGPLRQKAFAHLPGSPREIAGWIHEDHVEKALLRLSAYVGYRFDEHDAAALVGAFDGPDDWFEYPLEGSPALTVRMAKDEDSCVVMVSVSGDIDEVLAARIETLLDLLTSGAGQG